jgi:hypothetical protein
MTIIVMGCDRLPRLKALAIAYNDLKTPIIKPSRSFEGFNKIHSLQLFLKGEVERIDGSLVKYLHHFKRQLLARVR